MSRHHIFIDIETIPSFTPPEPESIQAPANYKDPAKIEAYQREAVEADWRKEALLSHKGRVLCIGWAVDDDDVRTVCVEPESYAFRTWYDHVCKILKPSSSTVCWVGFNHTTFDLNWLRHRAVKYGLSNLAHFISADRYPKNVFDLRQWWNGADYQGKGKLDEIAAFFGLEGKTDGIDGSKVFDFWQAGRLDEIAAYCRRDVELTRELFHIIKGY